jgi:hypothetical protein
LEVITDNQVINMLLPAALGETSAAFWATHRLFLLSGAHRKMREYSLSAMDYEALLKSTVELWISRN